MDSLLKLVDKWKSPEEDAGYIGLIKLVKFQAPIQSICPANVVIYYSESITPYNVDTE